MMIIENCKYKDKDKDLFGCNSEDQQCNDDISIQFSEICLQILTF